MVAFQFPIDKLQQDYTVYQKNQWSNNKDENKDHNFEHYK